MIEDTLRMVRMRAGSGLETPEEIKSDRDFLLALVTDLEELILSHRRNSDNLEMELEEAAEEARAEREDAEDEARKYRIALEEIAEIDQDARPVLAPGIAKAALEK